MLNKYNNSFNLISTCMILLNIFIVAINFLLNFVHCVVNHSFNNVLVNDKNNLSFTHRLENKMRFGWVLEYNKHISEKLIAIITGMDCVIFQPLHSMLGVHMVLNIVITERGRPSLHFNCGLALGVDLFFPTECNIETSLQTNHLWSLRIVSYNNHSIFVIVVLNVQQWMSRHWCRDQIWTQYC